MANPGFLTDLSVQDRQDLIAEAFRRLGEAEALLAQLVGVSDATGDHRADGQPDMACWLRRRFGFFASTARTWSRAGKAAVDEGQATVMEMWADGRLCADQVSQATKLVDLDPVWADRAEGLDASQLAVAYRLHNPRSRPGEAIRPSLKKFWDENSETLRLHGLHGGLDAATIEAALEHEVERLADGWAERGEDRPPWDELCAQAMANICGRDLGRHGDLDSFAIAIRVSAPFLCRGTGAAAEIIGGGALTRDEVVALLPGSRVEFHIENPDGRTAVARGRVQLRWSTRWLPDVSGPDPNRPPVSITITMPAAFAADQDLAVDGGDALLPGEAIRQLLGLPGLRWIMPGPDGALGDGRNSRIPPPWLRRLVRARDKACRVCGRRGWVHLHHVRWWREGGSTDDANLVWLCGACHRLVHRGFGLEGDPRADSLRLITPNGRSLVCRAILRM